jgi:UDP-hydrolysing UDP-N-acetyl-D-glucosamine 2-epimerase
VRVAVLTTGRQDWGILRSTCRALQADPFFDLRLLAGGMHCSPRFGRTVDHLIADGFVPAEQMAWLDEQGEMTAAEQAGRALIAVAAALRRQEPECLMLVGDRLETVSGAVAATLCQVPLVHLQGGEETEGAFDNQFRNAITKMSHLHLVSHERYGGQLAAMGEDPATVHVVGSAALDNLRRTDIAERAELESVLGLKLDPPVVVVTLHPATLGAATASEVQAVIAAMDQVPATYVITLPNSDPGSAVIRDALVLAASRPRRKAVEALGERRYWGLLRVADAVLGNSSSAVIEAPALALPTVNVGDRQKGRIRCPSVIDAPAATDAIVSALGRALEPGFRAGLRPEQAPFGDGHAAERIIALLRGWTPPVPPRKVSVHPR